MINQSRQWPAKLPVALLCAAMCAAAAQTRAQNAPQQDLAATNDGQVPEVIVTAQRSSAPASVAGTIFVTSGNGRGEYQKST